VPALRHFVCIDAETDGDPSLESFMHQGEGAEEIDWGDARGNLERLAGLVPTGGTTGPAKGVMVTKLSWGTMTELAHQNLRCEGSEPICLSTRLFRMRREWWPSRCSRSEPPTWCYRPSTLWKCSRVSSVFASHTFSFHPPRITRCLPIRRSATSTMRACAGS